MGDSYGMAVEIWAEFRPVDSTKKNIWVDYEQLLRLVFFKFRGQKKIELKHCSIRTEKLHRKKVKTIVLGVFFSCFSLFYRLKV